MYVTVHHFHNNYRSDVFIQVQGSRMDTEDKSSVPLNVISIHISQQRSLLSIFNTTIENTGIYACSGVSSQTVMFDSISIHVGKCTGMCTNLSGNYHLTPALYIVNEDDIQSG